MSNGGVFSARVVGWLAGIAGASIVLAFVLSGLGDDLTDPKSSGNDSYSRSAVGHRALIEFLEASGIEVERQRVDLGVMTGRQEPLLLLEWPPVAEYLDVDRRYDRRQPGDGPFVIALPKWRGVPDDERPGWVVNTHLLDIESIESVLHPFLSRYNLQEPEVVRERFLGSLRCWAQDGTEFQVEADPVQFVTGTFNFHPLIRCDGDHILVAKTNDEHIDPPIVIFADPDLLNTHGLGTADHAAIAEHVFADDLAADRLILDETIHGFERAPSLMAELLRFPLILAFLHGLLLLGVIVWSGVRRFGPAMRRKLAVLAGRTVLIDNAAELLLSGRALRPTLRAYFRHILLDVARRAIPGVEPDASIAGLQAVSRRRGIEADLAALEHEIETLSSSPRGEQRAVTWARKVHRWRSEMLHGRRTHR